LVQAIPFTFISRNMALYKYFGSFLILFVILSWAVAIDKSIIIVVPDASERTNANAAFSSAFGPGGTFNSGLNSIIRPDRLVLDSYVVQNAGTGVLDAFRAIDNALNSTAVFALAKLTENVFPSLFESRQVPSARNLFLLKQKISCTFLVHTL
jgi:hypothetical protein